MNWNFIIFVFVLSLILFFEYYVIIAIVFMEFILRLFGKSFDDEPKKPKSEN